MYVTYFMYYAILYVIFLRAQEQVCRGQEFFQSKKSRVNRVVWIQRTGLICKPRTERCVEMYQSDHKRKNNVGT